MRVVVLGVGILAFAAMPITCVHAPACPRRDRSTDISFCFVGDRCGPVRLLLCPLLPMAHILVKGKGPMETYYLTGPRSTTYPGLAETADVG